MPVCLHAVAGGSASTWDEIQVRFGPVTESLLCHLLAWMTWRRPFGPCLSCGVKKQSRPRSGHLEVVTGLRFSLDLTLGEAVSYGLSRQIDPLLRSILFVAGPLRPSGSRNHRQKMSVLLAARTEPMISPLAPLERHRPSPPGSEPDPLSTWRPSGTSARVSFISFQIGRVDQIT